MFTCRRCNKPVYHAERRQSMGFDWHRECLKCQECGKVLNPGQHAEHKETPYCHIPCYSALFGPRLFGHGSTVESHQSFGKKRGKEFLKQYSELEKKMREYNYYQINQANANPSDRKFGLSSRHELTSREVNGRLVLEGVLRVCWRVEHSIRIKEFHENRPLSSNLQDEVDAMGELPVIMRNKKLSHPFQRRSVHVINALNDKGALHHDDDDDGYEKENIGSLQNGRKITNGDTSPRKDHDLSRISSDLSLNVSEDVFYDKIHVPSPRSRLERSQSTTGPETLPPSHLKRQLSDASLTNIPDAKDCDTIGAALKKYQTLPANLDIDSLPRFLEHGLHRYEPSLNLALLEASDDEVKDEVDSVDVPEEPKPVMRSQGPRALRRRPGKKFDKRKLQLRRRSSFNGHWYDRETSVFTPPKDSTMSVWITSLVGTQEVLKLLLDKYHIESDVDNFALYVLKDNGERRRLLDSECPLLTRVNLGPHEDAARLYVMDNQTTEIRHEVAQFLRFSYAELRAILNMFYEEEEQEIERIKARYQAIKKVMKHHLVSRESEA